MPVTHGVVDGGSRLDQYAGYPFARPLSCPHRTLLRLDIPFQRSTHSPQYDPRLSIQSMGVVVHLRALRRLLGADIR